MITIPTVLVLGAGASVGVGFPTGAELRQLLLQVKPGQPLHTSAIAAKFTEADIAAFREAFWESQLDTIDIFLEQRPKLRAIGKFLIAAELIAKENAQRLTHTGEQCWYKRLRDLIGPSVDDLRQSQLKIITFNYDRSLEQYLYRAFRAVDATEDDPQRLVDYIGNLGFIHMHGSLGRMDWMGNGRPYGSATDAAVIKEVAHDLLLADEHPTVSYAGVPLADLFTQAQRVFFFGFGFNDRNLAKLGLPASVADGGTYYGASSQKLPQRTLNALRDRFTMTFYPTIETVFDTYFLTVVSGTKRPD